VISVEIHNEAIAGMFRPGRCSFENPSLHEVLSAWPEERGLCGAVVVAPDVGGPERARHSAEALSQRLAVLSKERDSTTPNRVVRSSLIGDVKGKRVLLVDDIIDTAGSVVAAVDELKKGGATDITVACAHPVFSGPAWTRLEQLAARAQKEGWSFNVVGTSAICHVGTPAWYHEFDIAPLLARVIRSVNRRSSVTRAQGRSVF